MYRSTIHSQISYLEEKREINEIKMNAAILLLHITEQIAFSYREIDMTLSLHAYSSN